MGEIKQDASGREKGSTGTEGGKKHGKGMEIRTAGKDGIGKRERASEPLMEGNPNDIGL